MEKGTEIARGKTKALFEMVGQPDVAIMTQFDAITAGDGARRHEIAGKGRLASQTTSRIFRLLNLSRIPTHYLRGGEDDDANDILVRRCNMLPIEVVVRGVAAGSFVKRRPSLPRGTFMIPRVVEFFLKDDAQHDPLIEPEDIIARGIASGQEISVIAEIARLTYEILAHAWRRRNTLLVDLKVEFGRIASGEGKGALVIADVIDNDSWRIWPQGREELMLDKQIYRDMTNPGDHDLARVRSAYEQVAELVGGFPEMRPAMIALVSGGTAQLPMADTLANALGTYGLPSVRHVTSMTRTPGHVLQLIQQLDAAFPRLLLVAIGTAHFAQMMEYATPTPVLHVDSSANLDAETVALRIAKTFALDDTVMFGRTLIVQGNMRAAVLNTDAQMNAQPQHNEQPALA